MTDRLQGIIDRAVQKNTPGARDARERLNNPPQPGSAAQPVAQESLFDRARRGEAQKVDKIVNLELYPKQSTRISQADVLALTADPNQGKLPITAELERNSRRGK